MRLDSVGGLEHSAAGVELIPGMRGFAGIAAGRQMDEGRFPLRFALPGFTGPAQHCVVGQPPVAVPPDKIIGHHILPLTLAYVTS